MKHLSNWTRYLFLDEDIKLPSKGTFPETNVHGHRHKMKLASPSNEKRLVSRTMSSTTMSNGLKRGSRF